MANDKQYPLKYINVEDISANKVALRDVDEESEDFISLVDSVKDKGILQPINVREAEEPDKYILTDGLQRWTAARLAGLKQIPALVMPLTDYEVLQAQLISNAHKIETKPVEYAQQIQRILAQDLTMTLLTLAGMLHKSVTWLGNMLGLAKGLSDKAKVLVNDGSIVPSKAYVLAKMPKEEQDNWLDRGMTDPADVFISAANERLKQIREAKRLGKKVAPEEWKPTPHLRKLNDLKSEIDTPKLANLLCKELSTPVDGFLMGVKFALHLDPESVRQAKEKEEARRLKQEEDKKKREEERERKKAEDSKKKLAALDAI